ncbi:MAG: hypothetical protein JW763_02275 [candidate division Zixibacteria bacterium]|nr:hypothetical protein [candidate division Zixibacteria bacterium]
MTALRYEGIEISPLFGLRVESSTKFVFGVGYKQMKTTLFSYTHDADTIDLAESATCSGIIFLIGAMGTYPLEATLDENAKIWGSALISMGKLSGAMWNVRARVLAGVRFWQHLAFSQILDFEMAISEGTAASSFERIAWGFGIAYCL